MMKVLYRAAGIALLAFAAVTVNAADHVYGTVSPWGQLVDPDGDCSFTVEREALTIGFSGAAHGLDAERGRMNAPRVLRSIDGDFAVEVTVDGNLPLPSDGDVTAYVSGGLLLLVDERNYIRLERASFTRRGSVNHYANFEQRIAGRRTRMGLFRDYPLKESERVDLRLEVKSGSVRALARIAGQPWNEMGTAKIDKDSTCSIGVSGVNTSNQPVDVTFRGLRHQSDFSPATQESSSEIDLASPSRITALPRTTNIAMAKLMPRLTDLQRRSKEIESMKASEKNELIDEAVALMCENDDEMNIRVSLPMVAGLSRAFRSADDNELAIAVYDKFIEGLTKLEEPYAKSMVRKLSQDRDALKFKLAMIGKPLELKGETLSGEPFDWESYRDKVVLVDFWASWCGPCRSEIPNVLEQYKQYHDQGFEVVGVCLDTQREKAESYVEDAELPWDSLFEEDAGWKHPMAVKYKISAIPTAILLDRDGKVISLAARGDELPNLLEAQFRSSLNTAESDDSANEAGDDDHESAENHE